MPLYRNLFRQAFLVTWQNKYLWFFGLFAALVGSGGYEVVGQGFASSSDTIIWIKDFVNTGVFGKGTLISLKNLATTQTSDMIMVGLILALFMFLAFFFFWLATISQAAIVSSVINITTGKDHSLQKAFKEGTAKFWPVFLINILVKVAIFATLLVINLPLVASLFWGATIDTGYFYVLMVVIFVPFLILASFMMKFVIAYIIVNDNDLITAIKRGFMLFMNNWLISIEMALFLFMISFMVTILVLIVCSVIMLPAIFTFTLAVNFFGMIAGLFIIAVTWFTIMAVILIASSFGTVLQISAWTYLFVELTGKGAVSKLSRVFSKVLGR